MTVLRRLVGLLSNLALLGASCAVVALLLDFVLTPVFLSELPLALHEAILPPLGTLAQSSKQGTLPRDYVALVGDSYAQGAGDWHLEVGGRGNPPYHSAHLIHDASGRDVISFGRAGAGSLRGLVSEPITRFDFFQKTARYAFEEPRDILVYFYEGNDPDDNVFDLKRRFDPDWDRGRLFDPAYFRRFIDEVVIGGSSFSALTESFAFHHNFFVLRSFRHGLDAWLEREEREAARRRRTEREVALDPPKVAARRPPNRLLAGGEVLTLRRKLQSPALALDEEEIELALYVFEQALARLRERFPESRTAVLYLPSPLSSYRLVGETASMESDHFWDRGQVYPAARVAERSDTLCEGVAERAARQGAGFRDVRPYLWAASAEGALHGPDDWKHLNRRGYQVLARAALDTLAEAPQAGCGRAPRPQPAAAASRSPEPDVRPR